jgi:hypothetical protein
VEVVRFEIVHEVMPEGAALVGPFMSFGGPKINSADPRGFDFIGRTGLVQATHFRIRSSIVATLRIEGQDWPVGSRDWETRFSPRYFPGGRIVFLEGAIEHVLSQFAANERDARRPWIRALEANQNCRFVIAHNGCVVRMEPTDELLP